MKAQKFILLLFLCLVLTIGNRNVLAQVSEGGTPPSFRSGMVVPQKMSSVIVSADFNVQEQIAADNKEIEGLSAIPLKMGKILPVNFSIENSGEWVDLPNGNRIWRLTIKAQGALATSLYYDQFIIPEGAKLFIYSADKRQVLGAYTSKTNSMQRLFATELIYGDEFTLEYLAAPQNKNTGNSVLSKADIPQIQITGIAYVYNYVYTRYDDKTGLRLAGFGNSGSCEVNVNCAEGSNWQDQKKGVVKTISRIGNTTYLCSGTIINNADQDLKPYCLSAYHCFGTQTVAELEQTEFYFHYEMTDCLNSSSEPTTYKTLVGAEALVLSPINGGSDGALLLLKDQIPADYGVFFNGWDNRHIAPTSGVGIHHPAGDVKKISTYTAPATSATYVDGTATSATGAHWDVRYVETQNGWGVTEHGSSGSPLFNQNGLVVGTLTGGTASCTVSYGTNLYGKLWYHWDRSPNSNRHMKTYLDPQDLGIDVLPGTYTAATAPTVQFRTSETNIYALESITYTNQSLRATSYRWIFEGGVPAASTERNPGTINYPNAGNFSTKLIINEGTPTEISKTVSITVSIKGGVAVPPTANFSFLNTYFEENFDNETFPPTNWITEKKGESNNLWIRNNVYGANFSAIDSKNVASALINYDDYSFVDSWFKSPACQIPSGATMEFYAGYNGSYLANGILNFLISTDSVNQTQKWTNGPNNIPGSIWSWKKVTIDLSGYGGQKVWFAWQYVGKGGDMAGVDGVKISAPMPVNTPKTIYVGDIIYPINTSTGPAVLYDWTFDGGTPSSSHLETPVVQYWEAGTHDVTLHVKNTAGEDTKEFKNAVTVVAKEMEIGYEVQGGYTHYPDFGRFIPEGAAIKYVDKTTNYPMSWNWTFAGGTPAASSEQNPSVVYSEAGNYGFNFKVTNARGEKNVTVANIIKVGGEGKIWNLDQGEAAEDVEWDALAGYGTGTNQWGNDYFAERFEAPLTSAAITSVDIAFLVVSKAAASIDVIIMDADEEGYPNRIINKAVLPVNSINATGYTTVKFPNPVPVSGQFFVSIGNFNRSSFIIGIKRCNRYNQFGGGFKNTTYLHSVNVAGQQIGYGSDKGWYDYPRYLYNEYISMNVVPTILYGSYFSVEQGTDDFKRKSTDNTVGTVTIHSNIAWQATTSDDWIEISNASGSGDGSFTFTVKENTGRARRGVISVGTGEFQNSIMVEQAGPPATNLTVVNDLSNNSVELKWNAPEIKKSAPAPVRKNSLKETTPLWGENFLEKSVNFEQAGRWSKANMYQENPLAPLKTSAAQAEQNANLCWHDGTMFDIVGMDAGGTYEVACRFTPTDLFEYHMAEIKEVEIYIGNLPVNNKLTLKFHQGGEVIYSQEVTVSDTEFITIPLAGNLYIDSRQDLYVGYEFTQTPMVYVAGMDYGPAVPDKGNLVSDDGGKSYFSLTKYGFNYNWIITVWLDLGSHLDYLVYRNNQLIETTPNLTYKDHPANAGTYCYKVVARYDGYLPALDSNTSCAEYTGLKNIDSEGITVYPNPASDVLTIHADSPVASIVITDAAGRIVFSEKNPETIGNTKIIHTSSWSTGVYIARISTGNKITSVRFTVIANQ